MSYQPFVMLDEQSELPLHRQIYEAIRRAILSGELPSGARLAASRLFAAQLGVSRTTVINAYEQLLAEGYLESRPGAGTYAARNLPEDFLQTPGAGKFKTDLPSAPRVLNLSAFGAHAAEKSRSILLNSAFIAPAAFQHGLPAVDRFPFGTWDKLAGNCQNAMRRDKSGHGDAAGYYPLRAAIAAHLISTRAVKCTPEQIIVTNGAQNAFDLIGRIFFEPQTEIWMEDPVYPGAKQAFRALGAKLVPVPVDRYGFDLEAALETAPAARFVYVTPSHQFPLGHTMTLARRLALLEWARKTGGLIIEDDYDSDFRYTGRPLASLQGLDKYGTVLYVGTFSKTIFPALRLGFIVVPPDMTDVFRTVRFLTGNYSQLIEQAVLAKFISEGFFAAHLRRMRRLYEERQEILVAEIKKHLAGKIEIAKSSAGMHLIGRLDDSITDRLVSQRAAEFGVKIAPVSAFSMTKRENSDNGLIFGYTSIAEKQIKDGVKTLVKVFDELAKANRKS